MNDIKIPKGIIKPTADKVGKSIGTVSKALGVYGDDSNIDVSESLIPIIKTAAIEVAEEKIIELNDFIKDMKAQS